MVRQMPCGAARAAVRAQHSISLPDSGERIAGRWSANAADWSCGQGGVVRGVFALCVQNRGLPVFFPEKPCAVCQSTSLCRAARAGRNRGVIRSIATRESMANTRMCGGRGLRLTQGGSPGYQRLADEDPQLRNDPAAQ